MAQNTPQATMGRSYRLGSSAGRNLQAGDRPAVSLIILAGGQGKRIGGDKASLRLGDETLLDRTIARLSPLGDDIIVVARPDQVVLVPTPARLVADLAPYQGAMAGIAGGLSAAVNEWSVLVACDMPFVSINLMRYLIGQTRACDAVVPRLAVGLEPLHAVYHKRCLPALIHTLERGERRLQSFFREITVHYVDEEEFGVHDPAGLSFLNINTHDDLDHALALLGQVPITEPRAPSA